MSDSLTFLGTSDGLPSSDRHHAALLLRLGGKTVLLDCGEPCSHTLKSMGVDFNSLDAVVVSHTHSDHVGGLPMLLQSMWLEQRTRLLPIWLPRRAIRPLRDWLHTCYLFEPRFRFRIRWHPIAPGKVLHLGPVSFAAFRTAHLEETRIRFARKFPGLGFDAFCFRFEAGRKCIGYSADLGRADDLAPLLSKPIDLLVVELAHFHPFDLVELLRERKVKHVAITHMGRAVRARLPEVRAAFRLRLPAHRVSFVRDGDTIRV